MSDRTRLANGLEMEVFEGPEVGPRVVVASRGAVRAALERFDPAMPWALARERILPMLPRVRPLPVQLDDLVLATIPPGILVQFGLDFGPAITFIGAPFLARWGVGVDALESAALDNVRRLAAACDPASVVRSSVAGVPVLALQSGVGIAAALILAPDCIARFFGPGPHLLLAPMRDLLLALPGDVDRDLASWIALELESCDPNCLHLGGFRHDRGVVIPEPLDEAVDRV